jgi:5-methylcytosine-specific restriction endonuclease McrA|tara:strand:+ start:49 stop:579 length:531 start_codon:yes stop_codon:yes gene_type:complete
MENTLTKKQIEKFNNRPNCSVPGCDEPAVQTLGKSQPNYPSWRRSSWIKQMHPDATDVYCCIECHRDQLARSNGYDTFNDFKNSRHPYLWARKKYCENEDGRLGFTCCTVLPEASIFLKLGLKKWQPHYLLEVDHINGNHLHNNIENLQTLCNQCHKLKTFVNKDNATPGRKTRTE